MTSDPNQKSPRTFLCREPLWEAVNTLAGELECSNDYLINEALKQYLRQSAAGRSGQALPSGSDMEGELRRQVIVGKAFVFFPKSAFASATRSWLSQLVWRGGEPRALTLSRVGTAPLLLPGVKLDPVNLPALSLGVVTSDKALYREGRDEVRLLAVDPLSPGGKAVVEIRANGSDFAKHPVVLNASGAAALDLRDLPVGEYEARLRGAPSKSPACSFTVAEYRLAPLVASLTERSVSGEPQVLSFELRLETFGTPVEGGVRLELTDSGARVAEATVEAREGVVKSTFPLTGKGPHAINVQLTADPSRTATVPIVGSREEERSETTFSALGAEVKGSLLPREGARLVRGLYLAEGAHVTTPFRLERVDTRKARIVAASAAESVRIVIVNPAVPSPRAGSIDPASAPHPGLEDAAYRRADALFREGKYAESLEAFEQALPEKGDAPAHPNYRYFIACCHARLGDRLSAIKALGGAVEDGWRDLAYLAADEDLASLRGYGPFEALVAGRSREIAKDSVAAGEVIEVDVPSPVGLVLIGAFVGDKPWEGYAVTVAPEALKPRVSAPKQARPGAEVTISVEASGAGEQTSAYLIIKDARLLGIDTPVSRLAGQSKAYAEEVSGKLKVGAADQPLDDFAPVGPPPLPGSAIPTGYPLPPPGMAFAAGPPPAMGAAPAGRPIPPPSAAVRPFSARPAPAAAPGGKPMPPPPPMAAPAAASAAYAPPAPPPPLGRSQEPSPSEGARAAAPKAISESEPEVLFAGLLSMKDGRASVTVRLGDAFADYVVEAFVLSGLDWAPVEARFRAAKDVFAALDLPAFVHPEDTAVGRVHAGAASGRMRVRVTRGGADVELFSNGEALAAGSEIRSARTELTFLCGPGDYEAVVEDLNKGASDRASKRVDAPGKMRRMARALRLLEPGQSVSLNEDPSFLSLRVLPGLDKPFKALVEATSDYGHACCEQTAAKILAACAMYVMSESDRGRELAESIILAGIRREETMWLRGRGFKMYPEYRDEPHTYWGPMAARHLFNLALLEDAAGPKRSPALARGIDEGLTMAGDAAKAYGLEWPPKKPTTCQDAYAALRFGKGAPPASLIEMVRKAAEGIVATSKASADRAASGAETRSFPGGVVGMRAEAAYAAAALLRAGGESDRTLALDCANVVVKAIGDQGRLYSTVDSVAAIALMAELSAARVVGGSGDVEVDGRRAPLRDVLVSTDAPRSVRALDSVAAVEVTRVVEEDWESLRGDVAVRISISKGMMPGRSFKTGDALDLTITLEAGYKAGDLVWVCLPDALSRVIGGGQVKRFSVDLAGRTQLSVPLAATSVTVDKEGASAPQHFAVCIRNMFEEERASSPGLLDVTVASPALVLTDPEDGGGGSFFGRMKRKLFG
jgi:hypothetical protein